MTVQTPEFIAPPAAAAPPATSGSDAAAAAAEVEENFTPEEAVAEITRLRESEAKWKGLSRTHERENKALKAKGVTAAPAAPATPAASTAAVETGPSEADLKALRFEVALDKGLPKSLALRLQGTTKEEMEEDAEDLAKLVAPKPVLPTGSADGGAGGSGKTVTRPFDDMVRAAAGIKVTTNY